MHAASRGRVRRWWHRQPVPALRRIIEPFFQPARFAYALVELPRFVADYYRYRRSSLLNGKNAPRLRDLHPVFGQRGRHEIDAHYIYLNAWAARQVVSLGPKEHIDVGSQLGFVSILGATVPVRQVEFRPVDLELPGLSFVEGSILELPFPDGSVHSLSSLHVIEHIGLGRYGDPIDPFGTVKAARELTRVLAKGGQLLVGLPMGKPRLCFNAHRVHDSSEVMAMFGGLQLADFCGVDDQGRFVRPASLKAFDTSEYACGFLRFVR